MTPRSERFHLGWTEGGRTFLVLWAAGLGLALAWASRDPGGDPGSVWTDLVVDANTAPSPVLGALPGLGPVLAHRIVEVRSTAPFRSIEDFDRRVKGIGPSKVAGLRPFLRFETAPNLQP